MTLNVVGTFFGTVDFDREHSLSGGADVLTASNRDGFLAKYDPTGALVWVVWFDGNPAGDATADAVAIDERGNADPTDDRVH